MFEQLFSMLNDGQVLTITLLKQGEKLTVGVLPQAPNVQDCAKSQIVPLNLIGTPRELDEDFISAINVPVQKVSGILQNMELYEQKTEKAASESKALKEKTEKLNKAIKDAEALESTKPREALIAYKKILEQDKYNSKVIGKVKILENKLSEGSLFGKEEIETIIPLVTGESSIIPENNDKIASDQKNGTEQISSVIQNTSLAGNPVSPNKPITEQKPIDMFEELVLANQGLQKEPTDISQVDSPKQEEVDPVKYQQFLQFMAMQEATV